MRLSCLPFQLKSRRAVPLLLAAFGWLWLMGGVAAAQGGQPRVTVLVAPDLEGAVTPGAVCGGCDGQITTGDALRGNSDPLPTVTVILRDSGGAEVQRATSAPEQFGAQTVSFAVAAPGTFGVELQVPPAWRLCPGRPTVRRVTAADFGADTGVARVDFGLWHGCAPSAPVGVTAPPAAPAAAGTGAIGGVAYADQDGDGQAAPTEPGVPGVQIVLGGNGPAQRIVTDAGGTYAFTGLAAGRYEVSVGDMPAGWLATAPGRVATVDVAGEAVAGLDFGFAPAGTAPAGPTLAPLAPGPHMPRTGTAVESSSRLMLGLAALAVSIGLLGLAFESGLARRS